LARRNSFESVAIEQKCSKRIGDRVPPNELILPGDRPHVRGHGQDALSFRFRNGTSIHDNTEKRKRRPPPPGKGMLISLHLEPGPLARVDRHNPYEV
jgi:hypothetical protein